LIGANGLTLAQTKTDGDTLFYDLTVKPEADAFGNFTVNLKVEDGMNTVNYALGGVNVLPINDFKPVFAAVDTFRNLVNEDQTRYLSENDFYSKLSATDADGDEVKFVVTEILSGVLDRTSSYGTTQFQYKVVTSFRPIRFTGSLRPMLLAP